MRTVFKILISLFISVATFVSLIYMSVSGYESIIEKKLYQPAIIEQISDNLLEISNETNKWHEENKNTFSAILNEASLKSCFLQKQDKKSIKERYKILENLDSKVSGFEGLSIIEDTSKKIHFSTLEKHILNKSKSMLSYKKYNKNNDEISLDYISAKNNKNIKITADEKANVFVYSYPFYDNYDVYRGTALFYVSKNGLLNYLSTKKIIALSDDINLITNAKHNLMGVLTGLPNIMSSNLKKEILKSWENKPALIKIISFNNDQSWILISKDAKFGFVARICNKDLFRLPNAVKYFLSFVAFLTIFLIVFLILNIRRDRFFIAQTKMQKLHLQILNNYIKNTEINDSRELQKKLEYHRHEVNSEIKKGLGKKLLKTNSKEIDELLQKNWDKIFSLINGNAPNQAQAKNLDNEEILALLAKLLEENKTKKAPTKKATVIQAQDVEEVEELDEVEELEEVEELDEVEELEEVEELDEVEELEELDEVEDLEEVQELDKVEELEGIEELDEVEKLEEIEELDEVEELEEVAELDEVEELEEVEELDEVEELEEVVELDEVEDLEEVADLDEVEELEEIEELDEKEKAPLSSEPKNLHQILKEIEEINEIEEFNDVSDENKSDTSIIRLEEFDEYKELQKQNQKNKTNTDEKDPLEIIENHGFEISGLDLTELNVPLSEMEEPDIIEVEYIGGEDLDSDLWNIYSDKEIEGSLSSIEELEVIPEENTNSDTIVSKDGIFMIQRGSEIEPKNKDFKALVDSVKK